MTLCKSTTRLINIFSKLSTNLFLANMHFKILISLVVLLQSVIYIQAQYACRDKTNCVPGQCCSRAPGAIAGTCMNPGKIAEFGSCDGDCAANGSCAAGLLCAPNPLNPRCINQFCFNPSFLASYAKITAQQLACGNSMSSGSGSNHNSHSREKFYF